MRELRNLTLLFTNREMADFLKSVLTKAGTPDKFFGFGFNDDEKIVHNRGNHGKPKDFTRFCYASVLENSVGGSECNNTQALDETDHQ